MKNRPAFFAAGGFAATLLAILFFVEQGRPWWASVTAGALYAVYLGFLDRWTACPQPTSRGKDE